MSDISESKEKTSDMMVCDGLPESKLAKDDDMSSTESPIDDRWKGYTMKRISNVLRAPFGCHWLISCSIQQEYYKECIKNPKCLELLKECAAQNEEAQLFYEDIEKQDINATTDDDSSSSSSLSVSSSAKKVGMFLVRNIKFNKSSPPD
eukprot:14132211-Ditylum_brightwellii.AAC.1